MSESALERTGIEQASMPRSSPCEYWVDEFVLAWRDDRWLTAARFVENHHELCGDKQLLALLAFEEFRLRSEAGEGPISETFFGQFRDCDREIEALRAVYKFIGGDSEIAAALRSSRALSRASEPVPSESDDVNSLCIASRWPELGQIVAGFKLLDLIGRGAYARVYLAEEIALGRRRVVVKASRSGRGEARTLGKLEHPNIVPVYSVQKEPQFGLTLICMKFVGRVTLHDVINTLFCGRRPFPTQGRQLAEAVAANADSPEPEVVMDPWIAKASYPDAIVHLGAQLADALAYTNSKSILHRDLKPSNVLIDAAGKPMLIDFNLSWDLERQNGRVGGTLGYAAPEIVAALVPGTADTSVVADPRSDLYSLGVILYELLSGTLPFGHVADPQRVNGSAAEAWLAQQRVPPRKLAELNPNVASELSDLIEGCLAYEIDQRPATAAQVAARLRQLLALRSRIKLWARRRQRPIAVALASLCLGLAAAGYALEVRPPYSERQFAAAQSASVRGDYSAALAHLVAAEHYGFDAQQVAELRGEVHYGSAKQLFGEGNFPAARDQCTKAIEAGRRTWQAYLLRARSRIQLREFDPALIDITAAEGRSTVALLYSARGDCMCGKSQWEAAIRAYHKAIADGFSAGGLLNNLAYALISSGKRRAALDFLDQAIAVDPSLADAFYQRASVRGALAVDQGEGIPSSAIKDIQSAIQLRPTNYRFYLCAAQLYAWQKRAGDAHGQEQAIDCLLNAVRLGLDPAQLPKQGPLSEVANHARSLSTFAPCATEGSQVRRSDPPGLVDSLASVDVE